MTGSDSFGGLLSLPYSVVLGETSWATVADRSRAYFEASFVHIALPEAVAGRTAIGGAVSGIAFSGPLPCDDDAMDRFNSAKPGRPVHVVRKRAASRILPFTNFVGIPTEILSGRFTGITLARDDKRGPFSQALVAALCRFSVHLKRANDTLFRVTSQRNPNIPCDETLRDLLRLTPKEIVITEEISRGLTIGEIAISIGIGLETVRFHIKNILHKAAVRNCVELCHFLSDLAIHERGRGADKSGVSVTRHARIKALSGRSRENVLLPAER